MPAKRQRRKVGSYINVRLSERDDPDLIQWWQSLPTSTGGELVRRAIRAYLASTSDRTPPTLADVQGAVQWIDRRTAERFDALTAQLAELTAQLASGSIVAAPGGQHTNSARPDVPQLTPEEIQAREARMKARRW